MVLILSFISGVLLVRIFFPLSFLVVEPMLYGFSILMVIVIFIRFVYAKTQS